MQYAGPALFALFVWWFSTGVIIFLDGRPRHTFKYSMIGATLLLAASIYWLHTTSHDASTRGAYLAFTAGLLAWGWQEISFYMGFVTGPRNQPCAEGCSGAKHFIHAIQTSLYHELAIVAAAGAIWYATTGGANQVGFWTFMVLWWMHQSAKLNVFLGVRNLNQEFLPEHLQFLKSFLTCKPMNLLFPVSVTVSTVIAAVLVQHAMRPGVTRFDAVGFTFLATLMALAILEHWFLVLPLPAAKLWHWSLSKPAHAKPFAVEIFAGFLGVGKTTYVRRVLATPTTGAKTIVLVNDFAAIGIDASLLANPGTDVVELPNGCICCSLRTDLALQLADIVMKYAPDRVVIEPSGVADLASLVRVLQAPDLARLIRSTAITTLLDAGAFMRDYARMAGHLEAQARLAGTIILNKADLATPAQLRCVHDTVRAINPHAMICSARYGLIDAATIESAPDAGVAPASGAPPHGQTAPHSHSHGHAASDHLDTALGLTSWSAALGQACDMGGLRLLLDAVTQGSFGDVERVKGIARSETGWVHFDVAGGRSSMAAFAPSADEVPRVVAIGRCVDEARLLAAFDACALAA